VWQKNLLERKRILTSIGSRLGVSAERAFREGLKKILGKYFNAVEILTSPRDFKP
jgi:hypothetical protein